MSHSPREGQTPVPPPRPSAVPHRLGRRWLARLFPFLAWRERIDAGTLRSDLAAGLTGAVVVLPQGVALATIAGMPPEYGLYAGMVPAVVAALWGSSWHLVSGPTTTASLVVFSSLSGLAEPGSADYVRLALTLTLLVGAIELAMGLARLGALTNFISHSVVLGFTAGAALLIAAQQAGTFFGVDVPRGLPVHGVLGTLLSQAREVNPFVTAVAVLTLVSGLLARHWWRRVSHLVVAMLAGSLSALLLNAVFGPAHTGIGTLSALPSGLPPLSLPDLSLETIRALAPAALATTLFALTEAVSIARALALRTHQHIDGSQEFIGQGLSNLAGSLFSGYVATGSFNRSAVNFEAGARTPLAAVFAGVSLVVVLWAVAPLGTYLPHAAMAGLLFLVAWGLLDFHHIRRVVRTSRQETAVMGVTFGATLVLDLEFAILAGVLLSLVLYLSRTSRPTILPRVPDPRSPDRHFVTNPSLPECPQLAIVRLDGSIFFGAVSHVAETFRRIEADPPSCKHLAVVATGINFVDVAGAEFLSAEAERRRARGGGLYLIRPKPGVRDLLARGGYLEEIGSGNLFGGKTEAIASIVPRLDPEVCRRCRVRIFRECAQRPGVRACGRGPGRCPRPARNGHGPGGAGSSRPATGARPRPAGPPGRTGRRRSPAGSR